MSVAAATPPGADYLAAALGYAARGWAVFPCVPGDKAPLTRNGFKDSTRDEDTIRAWWAKWARANVGLATGKDSGLWVLDVDGPAGLETWETLQAEHGPCPETLTARTGGGGLHLFFQYASEVKQRARFAPGLDTRAAGGYVIAAPSVHPNGSVYAWTNAVEITSAPGWLLELVAGPKPGAARAGGNGDHRRAGELARNSDLTSRGGQLRRIGWDQELILPALRALNTSLYADTEKGPLEDREVQGIAASVSRYEPAEVSPDPFEVWPAPALQAHEFPPRVFMLEPLIREASFLLLAGATGLGKTQIAHSIALAVAYGCATMGDLWIAPAPRPVVLIDSELPLDELKDRLLRLARGMGHDSLPGNLTIISGAGGTLDLTNPEHQLLVEAQVPPGALVVIDNWATVCRFEGQSGPDSAAAVAAFYPFPTRLRAKGNSTLLLDHHGKNAGLGAIGSARKGFICDVVMSLERTPETEAEAGQGMQAILKFTKIRSLEPGTVRNLELTLVDGPDRALLWGCTESAKMLKARILEMVEAGLDRKVIAAELNCATSTVYKYAPKGGRR